MAGAPKGKGGKIAGRDKEIWGFPQKKSSIPGGLADASPPSFLACHPYGGMRISPARPPQGGKMG